LIKGRVLDSAKVKGTIYLNFGENWRDDFTITLKTQTRRALIKLNLDMEILEFRYIQHIITTPAV